MRLAWPLIGRSKETRLILAALHDPNSAGIVVSGAAGVGKSRIARETLSVAASQGWVVRWVTGTSAARSLPLGALTPLVPSTSVDALEVLRSVIAALTAVPDGRPLVLGVDDAPLLDDLSTLVLHQIIQQRLAKVLLIVRSGEPVPPATQELCKAGDFDRLYVQPLSATETASLVSQTLGGPVDPAAAERLWTLTRGNPLYLRNIVEQEVADQRLRYRQGTWTWTGDPVVPPGLVELVEARIGALPVAVSDVIDVLAVGEPLPLHALTRITDAAAVEEADRRGLISFESADGSVEVRLAHPLYGEVRRARAPQTTLRRLRGLVAGELADSDHADDIQLVVRRATLGLDSDRPPDVGLLLAAARGAAWMLDLPLADRLAESAIRAGGGPEANMIRGFVLSWLGDGHQADLVLQAVDPDELTDVDRARLTFLRAVNRLFSLADPDGAKAMIDRLPHSAGGDPSINAFLCVYWASMGKPALALRYSRGLDPGTLPDALHARLTSWAVTVACGDAGAAGEAAAAAEAGYPIPVRAFIVISDAHVNALVLAGQISTAHDVATLMRHRAMASKGAPFAQIAVAVSGQAALGAGQLDKACSLLASAVGQVTAWNTATGFGYRYRILLATALAMRGMTDEAAAVRAELAANWHPSWRYLDYARAIADGWFAGCRGAVNDAVSAVRSAAEIAGANGQFAAEVMCLQTATQFGDASAGTRLHELADIVEGPRAGIAAHFADALQSADAGELELVAGEFEEIGDFLGAVDAAAHATVCFRRRNLRGSALRCSVRAETLAKRCGGACTPALRQAVEQLPLTDREREIVMMLGGALSNRDIAARLTLSVRTVESHIYNAMAKTGAQSREDLAALMSQPS
ncbi:transcriptional regulator, luxR family [Mycolicibacterium chubuense NBB4]|uniref:Transcriptional regulator, luxR family n=1 Tax=Mycolicibacterium chubuense (strain NBB4) TaxID=710421 RepID=I4BDL9_MYCCN|nr:LuxR family transcriptional regulator [Mycolicibacterium chubuense]AFM15376.1 transcriptional regulator, luxR family [Mycolicibacterium chubuense NBB4]